MMNFVSGVFWGAVIALAALGALAYLVPLPESDALPPLSAPIFVAPPEPGAEPSPEPGPEPGQDTPQEEAPLRADPITGRVIEKSALPSTTNESP